METPIIETTQAMIASTTTTYDTDIRFLLVNQIVHSVPTRPIKAMSINVPQRIELADRIFFRPQGVDLLLGAKIFWDILEMDRIQLGAKQLRLQSTKLRWLVCGEMVPVHQQSHNNLIICGLIRNEELHAQLEQFWQIEDIPNSKIRSPEETKCEDIFRNQYTRTVDGRFEVPLLFKEDSNTLGESKVNAFKRLRNMERKFQRDVTLRNEYVKFMNEYTMLGHMSPLPDVDTARANYLSHHAVVKGTPTSAKFRVVLDDASSPTMSGKSLNDCLMVGPTIQPKLIDTLLRFRQHPFVLTGDIVKIYRQVTPDHRLHQCILWRPDPEVPPHYIQSEHCYIRNGLSTLPGDTIVTTISYRFRMNTFSCNHGHNSRFLRRRYDHRGLIDGRTLSDQILSHRYLTKVAGFELAKFHANIPLDHEKCIGDYDLTDTKILGHCWQPTPDSLNYKTTCNSMPESITKQTILSLVTQVFDPLGLIGLVTIKAKILLQTLWQLKLDWDTPIPGQLKDIWLIYYHQLTTPRHAILHDPIDIQLHGFCDASQSAYGACIYLRSVDDTGNINVQLLTVKSRVAPLKTISLPRLELCSAVLLVNLGRRVTQALTCTITGRQLWTDSEIMLAWIRGEPSTWQTFVGNRTAEIQQLTDQQEWWHVRSEHNPADLISRGMFPDQFIDATLWWKGPP
ncbi:uncharacterized protein LOC105200170 [Solenopsis invicta]|uniref:uncharacterized protein LOC105200170 n=1 Tax=Solenopsis invicta TaxID=13686 RepID=UPI000595BB32|nr:uncharacterized protein LOC105200170 [Solenopsis invicta]